MTLEIWAQTMLRASLQGAVAVGLVWGICLLVRQKAPWARCWLWRLGYGKFALALLALAPLNVPLLPPAPSAQATVAQRVAGADTLTDDHSAAVNAGTSASGTATVEPHRVPSLASIQPATVTTAAPRVSLPPQPVAPAPRAGGWWRAALFIAWLTGVLFFILRLGRAWRHTSTLRRTGAPLTAPALQQMAVELSQRLGLRRLPALLAVERDGPLLTGVLRPAILLPRALLQGGSPEHLRLVLAHELAHLKRHDLFWNSLQAVIQTAFFFHPLLWLARAQTRLAQELACDALAVDVTQSSPAIYGRRLLDVVEFQQVAHTRLLGAGVAASARTLKRRIFAMKNLTPSSRKRVVLVGTVLTFGGALALLPWRVVAQNVPAPTAEASGPATAPSATGVTGTAPSDKTVTQTIPIRFQKTPQGPFLTIPDGSGAAASTMEALTSRQLIGPNVSVTLADDKHALVLTGGAADVHRLADIIGAWEFRGASQALQAQAQHEFGGRGVNSSSMAPVVMPREVLEMTGFLHVSRMEVASLVEGTLKEVAVRAGEQVKKGTVLFKLDDRAATAAVEMAKLNLRNAELTLNNPPAGTDRESAQNQVAMATIQLQLAQDALDDLSIRAPQDGTLEEIDVRPGQRVTKDQPLTIVDDLADMSVSFGIAPEYATRIKVGQSFTLCAASGPAVSGEITFVSSTIPPGSRELNVRGKIVSGNHLERFLGGMTVTIYLTPAPLPK